MSQDTENEAPQGNMTPRRIPREVDLAAAGPQGGGGGGGNGWMVTFTDLVSLMLTFFVMLFSMSSVKIDKWETMIDTLSTTLNPSRSTSFAAATAEQNIGTIFRRRAINLDYLASILHDVERSDILKSSHILRLEDRLVIALPGDLLFNSGSAVLSEEATRALFHLGGVLRNIGNQIGIDGHSDPDKPRAGTYASNWELSTARAVSVANGLRRSGYDGDLIAFGHSDTQYGRLPALPDEERRALARRVDIVVLPSTGD